jgi:hypothetical protein
VKEPPPPRAIAPRAILGRAMRPVGHAGFVSLLAVFGFLVAKGGAAASLSR